MKILAALALALFVQNPQSMSGHGREISSIAVSPNGKMVATGSVDLTVRLWDPGARSELATLEGHDGEVKAVAFSPDSKLLASGEMYKKLKIWDVATQKEIAMYSDFEGAVTSVAFSPDGKRLFAGSKDNAVRAYQVGSPADGKKLGLNYAATSIAVSPDGKWLAVMDDNGAISLWDAVTLKRGKSIAHATPGKAVAWSADSKTLVSSAGGTVKLWDAATGAEKATAKADGNSVAMTPNGETVVVGTQDAEVMFFSGSDLSLKMKSTKHDRPVTGVAISPDGKTAYTCSMDRLILIWAIK